MAKILVVYSSTDGQTLKICARLKQLLEQHDAEVILVSVEALQPAEFEKELAAADKVIIGASIRYGKHSPKILALVEQYAALLGQKPNAFFSVNLVARKPERSQPETNPYMVKFLGQISWKPQKLAVFAGKLDYPKYKFSDRLLIRLIMWMTKGPTDPKTVIEYTNWQRVDDFGRQILAL